MKVLKKQKNSRYCIICGMDNNASVKAPFYEMEDKTIVSKFKFRDIHQSYPGRVHGGMITAMLDELIGRALWIDAPDTYGVTTNLSVKYRKAVPYGQLLVAVGKLTKNTSMFFAGVGKIFDENGDLLAEAEVNYIKLPPDKIQENLHADDEMIYQIDDGVTEIDMEKYKI